MSSDLIFVWMCGLVATTSSSTCTVVDLKTNKTSFAVIRTKGLHLLLLLLVSCCRRLASTPAISQTHTFTGGCYAWHTGKWKTYNRASPHRDITTSFKVGRIVPPHALQGARGKTKGKFTRACPFPRVFSFCCSSLKFHCTVWSSASSGICEST